MTRRSRSITTMSLFVALLLASSTIAQAASIIVWPAGFRPDNPTDTAYTFTEGSIIGGNTALLFSAPLRLPIGSRLQSATMSWRGQQNASVQCRIMRKRFLGEKQLVASVNIFGNPTAIDWTPKPLVFEAVDRVIRGDSRYYVELDLFQLSSEFGGVKISYFPPVR